MKGLSLKELSAWLAKDDFVFKKKASALKGFMRTMRIEGRNRMDAKTFMKDMKDNVVRLIHEQKKPFKTKLILEVEFYKKKTSTIPYFHSETETITDASDVGEELDLLLRKGVYPYDYMNCLSKLDETALPKKEEFFSKLNDADISDEDYQHAQKVWKVFKMNTMRDYHNLYLLSDVLLLMDAFEAFRDVCLENYKLDPCWYYTAPGLSWDAMLKMTQIRLELLTDVDMLF
ncbi:hypothetical protein QZH41_005791 [Actinostola sp. cb2023]|nr:hypothetical protein QZH41_005791 [Actinostola sp. cb2023]